MSFQSLLTAVSQTKHRLYVMIDEYDNFANDVLMNIDSKGRQRYEALLLGGRTAMGKFILWIPNLVARNLYFERIQKMILPDVDKNWMMQKTSSSAIKRH